MTKGFAPGQLVIAKHMHGGGPRFLARIARLTDSLADGDSHVFITMNLRLRTCLKEDVEIITPDDERLTLNRYGSVGHYELYWQTTYGGFAIQLENKNNLVVSLTQEEVAQLIMQLQRERSE